MRKAALTLSLILSFSVSLMVGVQFANVAEANPYNFFWEYVDPIPGTIPAEIAILSPENNTTYSEDDLNLTVHITRPETPDSTLPGNMWVRYYLECKRIENEGYNGALSDVDISTVLYELAVGNHELRVEAECFVEPGNMTVFSITSSSTVFFAVVDVNAPIISSLSVANKTYSQNDLSLNFTVDESTSWIGYSLDGAANVTATGNVTLPKLALGSHTLNVYANDSSGNMGASETIDFTIAEIFPTSLVIAPTISVAVIAIGLLVYFKKRKR